MRMSGGRMYDALVVGAGMAGLAAADRLTKEGSRVALLEARNRTGGRVWTDRQFAGIPVELGAEFLHGDQVATWEIVRELGLETLRWKKQDDSLVRTEDGEWLTMAQARAADPGLEISRSWELPQVLAGRYEDLHSYLRRIGFDRKQLRYVERWFANAQGESARFLSAAATLRGLRRSGENGSGDYRLTDGYDNVVNHLAKGLDVHLNTQVETVEWGSDGVLVAAADGATYEARTLLLTVPVGVLQAGSIRFMPELPDDKLLALSGIRMGPVIKLVYRFAEPIAESEIMAIYSRNNPPMWWSPSYRGHGKTAASTSYRGPGRTAGSTPYRGSGQSAGVTSHCGPGSASEGSQVWTAFVSGAGAASLLALGEQGALEAGVEALGNDLGRELEPLDALLVDWPGDPWSRGGYSYVLPGHDGARELLARPAPPLFFAGEATAQEHQSATVHGALVSGRRAAAEALAFLSELRAGRTPAALLLG